MNEKISGACNTWIEIPFFVGRDEIKERTSVPIVPSSPTARVVFCVSRKMYCVHDVHEKVRGLHDRRKLRLSNILRISLRKKETHWQSCCWDQWFTFILSLTLLSGKERAYKTRWCDVSLFADKILVGEQDRVIVVKKRVNYRWFFWHWLTLHYLL
jgi:hypothetical protein